MTPVNSMKFVLSLMRLGRTKMQSPLEYSQNYLKILLRNKDFIIEAAEYFRLDPTRAEIAVEDEGIYLDLALCDNAQLHNCPSGFIIKSFLSFKKNTDKCSIFPVGGEGPYQRDERQRSLWLNPERWEFVEHMLNCFNERLGNENV